MIGSHCSTALGRQFGTWFYLFLIVEYAFLAALFFTKTEISTG
jgi:hypothetical protein